MIRFTQIHNIFRKSYISPVILRGIIGKQYYSDNTHSDIATKVIEETEKGNQKQYRFSPEEFTKSLEIEKLRNEIEKFKNENEKLKEIVKSQKSVQSEETLVSNTRQKNFVILSNNTININNIRHVYYSYNFHGQPTAEIFTGLSTISCGCDDVEILKKSLELYGVNNTRDDNNNDISSKYMKDILGKPNLF